MSKCRGHRASLYNLFFFFFSFDRAEQPLNLNNIKKQFTTHYVERIILPGHQYCYPTNYQNQSELHYCSYALCTGAVHIFARLVTRPFKWKTTTHGACWYIWPTNSLGRMFLHKCSLYSRWKYSNHLLPWLRIEPETLRTKIQHYTTSL